MQRKSKLQQTITSYDVNMDHRVASSKDLIDHFNYIKTLVLMDTTQNKKFGV